ncbi:MAG: mannitol-1-phosphate 5-dehydrogenase [Microbacteriaceae bacterium]
MSAVHFGAGNIGRGFIGLLLHNAGHHVTFVDVAAPLIDEINATDSYRVIETGAGAQTHTVTDFGGLNSVTDADAVVEAIAGADIVTTAVGPNILKFVAPLIARGLAQRSAEKPLVVMACENAISATDLLRAEIAQHADEDALARGRFANTAVDRIVPIQPEGQGLDVTVESFCEWVIESTPFGADVPTIPGAHFVADLAPYIERKLLTVNTGHASTAYLGKRHGATFIAEALENPEVLAAVQAVLAETTDMLVRRHGLDADEQKRYAGKTVTRFQNPGLADLVDRVGRQPLRKLSRHERLIEPAAALAEVGVTPTALLAVVTAAIQFDVAEDPESVELQQRRGTLSAEAFATEVCGIDETHPLFDALVVAIRRAN